jgi:hypothetical protein
MMKTKITLAALLLAAVMVTPSYGANELFIEGAEDYYRNESTRASWFFRGVTDTRVYVGLNLKEFNFTLFNEAGEWEKVSTPGMIYMYRIRVPEGVNYGHIHKVVARYVHNHPEDHRLGAHLVNVAVQEAWPDANKSEFPPVLFSDLVIRRKTAEEQARESQHYKEVVESWKNK